MIKTINEQKQFWLLILFTFIIAYFTPGFVSWVIFLVFALLAFRSERSYFWIAFFFFIFDGPGRLFLPRGSQYASGIPSYGFQGFAFLYSEIIITLLFLKAFSKNKKWNFIFRNDIIFLMFFLLFVFCISFINGSSSQSIIKMFRATFPLLLIFSLPVLLKTNEEVVKLDSLIFPLVYLAFASQIYTFFSGVYLVDKIAGSSSVDPSMLLVGGEDAARVYNSVFILLYAFHKSLFYFFSKQSSFNRTYLLSIIIICFLSLFLSATRGWILAYVTVFLLCGMLFGTSNKFFRFLRIGIASMVVFIVLINVSQPLRKQVYASYERFSTVTLIASGDITAGGTSSRLSERGPKVLAKVIEKPIFGWGFSDTYFQYADNHVGHHTILLNTGILGYIIFSIILFKWIYDMFYYSNNKYVRYYNGKSLYIFAFSLIFIFIVHSTSRQLWGFTLGDKTASFFAVFLLLTSFDKIIRIRQ